MRYRVAFARRFQSDGNESDLNPTAELDAELPDGVVADKVFVGRFDPESKHSQEVMDEDDAFLGSAAAELWEYDVIDGNEQEFLDAVRTSETVMEFTELDETSIDTDDVTGTNLDDSDTRAPDEIDESEDVARGGSGRHGADDGPAGQVTGDPSAGDLRPSRAYAGNDELEGIADEGSGGIDSLNIVSADDPTLGLTDRDGNTPDDWAADTGPTRNPGSGIRSGE
ncbi:MAG: hypothetical protein ACJ74Y_12375 [Bryobacteraceae bacterium]